MNGFNQYPEEEPMVPLIDMSNRNDVRAVFGSRTNSNPRASLNIDSLEMTDPFVGASVRSAEPMKFVTRDRIPKEQMEGAAAASRQATDAKQYPVERFNPPAPAEAPKLPDVRKMNLEELLALRERIAQFYPGAIPEMAAGAKPADMARGNG